MDFQGAVALVTQVLPKTSRSIAINRVLVLIWKPVENTVVLLSRTREFDILVLDSVSELVETERKKEKEGKQVSKIDIFCGQQ